MAEQIRFGIIGAVKRGGSYVASLQANPASCITALCDISTEQLATNAAELGIEHTFENAEAMLDSLGFVVSEIITRFRFGRDQGRVVEQDPPADSLLAPGSSVRLVVGRRSNTRRNRRN